MRVPTSKADIDANPMSLQAPSLRTRLALLAASAVALFGARYRWATPAWAERFQAALGYWFVLALLVVTIGYVVSLAIHPGWFTWARWRADRVALALIVAGTIVLHLHEPHMLRVLYDEPTHALAALSMHADQSAVGATVSNYVGATFVRSEPYAITRPYLFPLLASLIDDVSRVSRRRICSSSTRCSRRSCC